MQPRFLPIRRAAEYASVSQRRLRRAVRAGEVSAYDAGAGLLVDVEELAEWLRSLRVDVTAHARARAAERIALEDAKRGG